MSTSLDNASPQKLKKNGITSPKTVTFTIHSDKKGQYYQHPQKGRLKVIALHCNCGRSVLVRPAEAKSISIICSLCNSPFSWQQLTFSE